MKIVTYNIRCVYKQMDGINSFIHRIGPMFEKINEEKPDVIGFQEVLSSHLTVLEKLLGDEYQIVGQFRNADYSGEGVYTAIKKETCQLLGFETIWLSPTPYVAGSRFDNQSSCPRICLQTLVREKETGRRIRVYNLHLDHISEAAKVEGITAALSFMDDYSKRDGFPAIILGDFNATPDSKTVKICKEKGGLIDATENVKVSFHHFGTEELKIDYIFLSSELNKTAKPAKAWDETFNTIFLSDHYPVEVEL